MWDRPGVALCLGRGISQEPWKHRPADPHPGVEPAQLTFFWRERSPQIFASASVLILCFPE